MVTAEVLASEGLSEIWKVNSLNHKLSDAEFCRLNGWGPGARLVGDEGYGPMVIEITAVGERAVLAKVISHDGIPEQSPFENHWTLTCREWRLHEEGDVHRP